MATRGAPERVWALGTDSDEDDDARDAGPACPGRALAVVVDADADAAARPPLLLLPPPPLPPPPPPLLTAERDRRDLIAMHRRCLAVLEAASPRGPPRAAPAPLPPPDVDEERDAGLPRWLGALLEQQRERHRARARALLRDQQRQQDELVTRALQRLRRGGGLPGAGEEEEEEEEWGGEEEEEDEQAAAAAVPPRPSPPPRRPERTGGRNDRRASRSGDLDDGGLAEDAGGLPAERPLRAAGAASPERQQDGVRTKARRSSSKFFGVIWRQRPRKWEAQVRKNGRYHYAGRHATEEEAARAHDALALVLGLPTASLNFPPPPPPPPARGGDAAAAAAAAAAASPAAKAGGGSARRPGGQPAGQPSSESSPRPPKRPRADDGATPAVAAATAAAPAATPAAPAPGPLCLSDGDRRAVAEAIACLCRHKLVCSVAELQAALCVKTLPHLTSSGHAGREALRALLRDADAAANGDGPASALPPGFERVAFDAEDDEFCYLAA